MSRGRARQCLAPGTSVARGEVLVATEIGDPVRGLLPCPAAPLVAGVLARRGVRVRYGAVPDCAETSQADNGAALFVTSALRRDGEATAIGAAADAVDGVAVAAARGAVEEWSAVAGPRRVLRGSSPWCPGALAALARSRQAVAEAAGPVYIYGWLAATEQSRAELRAAGAEYVTSLAQVTTGATVVFPAHGVDPAVRAEAAERELEVIDGTCPLVAALHEEIRQFADRGDQIVIVGPPGHAVVPGIAGQAPGHTTVVASLAGAAGIGAEDPRRVSYVLQPGIPVEDTTTVSGALRSRFPALRGPDPGGFCYAASDRAETVRTVAAGSDVVLVLGSAADPDTRMVTGLARGGHAKAHVIADTTDIVPSWLTGATAIGLAETASARPGLTDDVTRALSGLGPLSVTRRHVTTEVEGRTGIGAT